MASDIDEDLTHIEVVPQDDSVMGNTINDFEDRAEGPHDNAGFDHPSNSVHNQITETIHVDDRGRQLDAPVTSDWGDVLEDDTLKKYLVSLL